MKKFRLLLLALSLVTLVSSPVWAAARSWTADPIHTNIYFSIDHIYAKVQGRFQDFTTQLNFDPANLPQSSINFSIKVDSIDTGEPKRDKHLLSPDFFDSSRYPLITFASTGITAAAGGMYQVAGKLTVKGETHDIVLPLHFEGIKDHPAASGKEVIGLNGHIVLDRLALKVGTGKFVKMGIIGKDVDVLVTIEALAGK